MQETKTTLKKQMEKQLPEGVPQRSPGIEKEIHHKNAK